MPHARIKRKTYAQKRNLRLPTCALLRCHTESLERTCPAVDLPDLSLMMLSTGCRIGEFLAIGRDEIDLDQATVDVCWRLVCRTGVGLLRLSSTKSEESGERLIPLLSWAVTMLKRRRLAIASEVQAVFPDSLGGRRVDGDPTPPCGAATLADAGRVLRRLASCVP